MSNTRHSRRELGQLGEAIAAKMLSARGYTIVERNWRCGIGEIDLVARDADTWVFVEVKLRRSSTFGDPQEAVTPRKQAKLLAAAIAYIESLHLLDEPSWRIDVIAILLSRNGTVERLDHFQDAVRADG
jgi:putative endonuclease